MTRIRKNRDMSVNDLAVSISIFEKRLSASTGKMTKTGTERGNHTVDVEMETISSEKNALVNSSEIDQEAERSIDASSPAIGVALEMDSELENLIDGYKVNDNNDLEEPSNGSLRRQPENPPISSNYRCAQNCQMPYRIGRCVVISPQLYKNTGIGIIGPHFLGVIFTVLFLSSISYFFVMQASEIGNITLSLAYCLTASCYVNLFFVVFVDPGFIHASASRSECRKFLTLPNRNDQNDETDEDDNSTNDPDSSNSPAATYRFCGLCSVYQPADARHCQDCGMCVIGYDHHCPWMGICIGKYNMRAFVLFNFSWLIWLLFAIGWIAVGSNGIRKS